MTGLEAKDQPSLQNSFHCSEGRTSGGKGQAQGGGKNPTKHPELQKFAFIWNQGGISKWKATNAKLKIKPNQKIPNPSSQHRQSRYFCV